MTSLESEEVVITLTLCLSLILKGISEDSQYSIGPNNLWWLAVALLQSGRRSYRAVALELGIAALQQARHHEVDPNNTYDTITRRATALSQLDAATGVSFETKTHWGFSMIALVYPALEEQATRERAQTLIRDLYRLSLSESTYGIVSGGSVPLFLALYVKATSESSRHQLWLEACYGGESTSILMPPLFSMLDVP